MQICCQSVCDSTEDDVPAVWCGSQDQCTALCRPTGPHGAGGVALDITNKCRDNAKEKKHYY